jgi:hypothetical protein
MGESVTVRLLGTTFVAVSQSAAVIAQIRRLWHPFVVQDIAVDTTTDDVMPDDVMPDDVTVVTLDRADAANGDFAVSDSSRLSRFAVAVNAAALDRAPDFAVHCGVVASGETAIAIPGTSGMGKSTLTAACLRVGFGYVSDEALCLRAPDGSVVPYPRPVALSPWSTRAVEAPTPGVAAGDELLFTAADLGSTAVAAESTVGHIVLLDRRSGSSPLPHEAPLLHEASRPAAVTRLLELSFNHYRRPANAVQLAATVVGGAAVWTLEYGDPLEAARLLRSELGGAG